MIDLGSLPYFLLPIILGVVVSIVGVMAFGWMWLIVTLLGASMFVVPVLIGVAFVKLMERCFD